MRDTAGIVAFIGAALVVLSLAPGSAQERAHERAQPWEVSPAPLVDADMPSIEGRRRLADERDRRVIVLFYEDRPHVYDNDVFKGELRRFVDTNGLGGRVVVYGVANLGDAGGVPEALVRTLIRPAVDRWGVDILLDWEGSMRRAPFQFETDATNVGIIDRSGRLVFRYTGTMSDESRRAFYRTLRAALR